MNVGLISLLALILAIVLGFTRKTNVGILSIGFAMVITILFKSDTITTKAVISGFSTSLFIQMVGVTYLFAIINGNGTLELMAKKIVNRVPVHAIPVAMFFIGMVLSAVGPGSIPCLAIIPVIAIPLSISAGINPIMVSIIGDMGAMAGRMSPLTPEAAVVRSLMEAQGMEADTVPIMICTAITAVICSILIYIYYKGWQVDKSKAAGEKDILPKFNWQQLLSLLGLILLAVGVLALKWNVGLTVDGMQLVAMVVIGGTIAGYTPISTTGALIMAGVAQQPDSETRFPQNKMFVELFAVSVLNLVVLAIMALCGVYTLII